MPEDENKADGLTQSQLFYFDFGTLHFDIDWMPEITMKIWDIYI